jgi:hypothetical protein
VLGAFLLTPSFWHLIIGVYVKQLMMFVVRAKQLTVFVVNAK